LDPPEILTTAFSSGTTANINSISTLGYTGLSNQVGGAPPGKAAPSGSATLYDKDGIPYHAMDKKTAEKRIRNQQGFRRACDHDRKLTLLENEPLVFDAEYIRKKFISYGQLLSSSTISAGDTMSKLDFEQTWNQRKKCVRM